MPVTVPIIGSQNWGEVLNAALLALAQANDTQKLTTIASGVVTVHLANSDSGLQAVTFPIGRFTATPVIVVSLAASSATYAAGLGSPTANGFNAIAFNRTPGANLTVDLPVNWIAVAST